MMERFAPELRHAILLAEVNAKAFNRGTIHPAHLLLGLLDELELQKQENSQAPLLLAELFTRCGTSTTEVRAYTLAFLEGEKGKEVTEPRLSGESKRMLEFAVKEARRSQSGLIHLEHLFLALLYRRRGAHLAQILAPLGLTVGLTRGHLRRLQDSPGKNSPLTKLNPSAKSAIDAAHAAMRATYCGRISTLHLLIGLLADETSEAVATLHHLGIELETLREAARREIRSDGEIATFQRKFTAGAKLALVRAQGEARSHESDFIGPEHLLLALLPRRTTWQECASFGTEVEGDGPQLLSRVLARQMKPEAPPTAPPPEALSPDMPPHDTSVPSALWSGLQIMALIAPFFLAFFSMGTAISVSGSTPLAFFTALLLTTSGSVAFAVRLYERSPFVTSIALNVFCGLLVGTMAAFLLTEIGK